MSASEDPVLAELRKIRELLEPKPAPPAPAPKGIFAEFRAFLSQYKVLGLAVAFILGIYLGALVKSLVSDFILPVIQVFIGSNQSMNTYMVGPFGVGDFANSLLTFVIVALVIFMIVKISKRYRIE